MIVELHAKSDVGRVRRGNEDNFLVLDLSSQKTLTGSDGNKPPDEINKLQVGDKGLVLVVSDGMGGALAGDVASRMAVDSVREMLIGDNSEDGCAVETPLVDCLKNATVYANLAIHKRSQEDSRCAGMGATFTGAAVKGDMLDLVQVGDSRGYMIRRDQIRLATKDQSLVQQLVDVGQISEAEAETHMFRNVILQALGAQSEIIPVTGKIQLRRGDMLLLCSDGLSNKVSAANMQKRVVENIEKLEQACADLVKEANENGGEDNITVILAKLTGDRLTATEADEVKLEMIDLGNIHDTADQDTDTAEML